MSTTKPIITKAGAIYFVIGAAAIYKLFLSSIQTTLNPDQLLASYDYIIIGGGSAGSVVAARLSENPNKTVLLIESGFEETETSISHIPRLASMLVDTKFDWMYETEPQKSCCEQVSKSRRIKFPRGKVLGGTGILNFMIYTRGHPEDYDNWAKMGNEGWSYKDVLPYFKKSETIAVKGLMDSDLHGRTGPMYVSEAEPSPTAQVSFEAAKSLGYNFLKEMTGTENNGLGVPLFAAHNGVRQSSANRFLRPAMARKNLHVISQAHVTRILINATMTTQSHRGGLRATGVEFQWRDGKSYNVSSRNEIILSAGAIASPQVLMHSGIGPEDHLKEVGVPLVHHLPAVGSNLEDHLRTCMVYLLNSSITGDNYGSNYFEKSWLFFKNAYLYLAHQQGIFAQPATESMGFFRSGFLNDSQQNDLQMNIFRSEELYPALALLEKYQVFTKDPENLLNEYWELFKHIVLPGTNVPMVMATIIQLHPHSKGTVRLRSNDPTEPPVIDPNYGSNDIDIKVQARGMRIFMNIVESEPFKKFGPKLFDVPIAGCRPEDGVKFQSDEYLECIAKKRLTTNFHPISTCRMGDDPKTSVVDSKLKVHGIEGLRIADASVFPGQISGNPNAPAMMVAEKAADLIKLENES